MDWTTTHDLDTFLTTAGAFLRTRPDAHTLLLGVTATLAASGPAAYGDRPPRYGWRHGPDGRVDAAFTRLMLWEADGRPAALAGRSRTVAGMARVGPGHTPPELRRNGYAAGATAAVSRAALASGAGQVLLFADAANRTSTALYERLGYRRTGDHRRYDFPPDR
ncbi:GNAT family N-acetyltransferase [Streptomyces sp. NPDC047117]|uniref:GNAT family N-acetyltransferase n=1 Tax=Streptomyces sp. NPDC047117 TaxID=3155379 RepID=UPI0033CF6847